ncbi:unconventional myosin-X-like [Lethenteron reissneri]|uniref:unconventional myosin-X-like n=1 Tax=Lethenteron reissneri TaxID=7753 RepID=UPI002AB61D72|nr:unconventional myosin-X-like [Lethenteron reissneri]
MDDLSQLEQVNEEAILHVLHSRYKQDIIYTYIGPVLVAVNPYKSIPGLYGATQLGHYLHHRLGELPSHIYAMASELYRGLWSRTRGQCVLISGESGAGKTESAKLLLGCLTAATRCCAALGRGEGGCGPGLPAARGQRVTAVQQALVECGLVLEAFGNARTAHNDNSSRVGKLVQLHFSRAGFIQGGVVLDYLLEKTRVVQQNPGDRNFHIFYALLAGASSQQMERLYFSDVGCHRYLNQQDCILSDKDTFNRVSSSLHALGLQEGQVDELWKLMAGIIHLGNMTFTNVGGAQLDLRNPELGRVAELLHVEPTLVVEVLTRRSIILRGEDIRTRLSVQQAEEYRDSLAMALYSRCFSWLLGHVNNQIHGPRDFHSIGILDIFGFENLKVNRFEQFNINYANEKLQGYFNKHMFSVEEQEYKREGIEWKEIPWMDNKDCLDLIEEKLGVLALINEESLFPRGTNNTLLNKLHHHHSMNSCYIKPRMESRSFGIRHYAGEVCYMTVQGFVEKNRDDCHEGVLNLLLQSRSGFVWKLFGDKASGRGETLRPSQRKPTLLSQFKDSLRALMVMLSSVHPFFIRCIKPNRHKMPEQFDQASVLGQLRFSGVLGMVHLRQAGFPARRDVHEFHNRYRVLMRKLALPEDTRSRCASFLRVYDSSETQWQLGKSRVFMHEGLERELERQRNEEWHRAATVIRAHALGYATRKWYRTVLQSVLTIQRSYRTHRWRRRYLLPTAASAFPGTGAIPSCCLTPCVASTPGVEFACPPSAANLDYQGTAEITTPSVLTDENIPIELNDNTNTSHMGTESLAIEDVEEATVLRMEESPVPEVLTTDNESVYLRSHKNHLVLPAREMATDTFQTDIGGSGQSDEMAEFGIFIGSSNYLNLNVGQKNDTVITRVSDSCHEDGTLAFPDMLHMKQAEEFHLLELPLDKEPMAQPLRGTISGVQCNQTGLDVDVTKAFQLLQVNVTLPHCTECFPDIQPIAIGSQSISENCSEQEQCSAGGQTEVVSPYSSEEHGPPLLGAEEAMRLDAEATRAGHEFLESLRFDDIFHSIEESLEGNVAQAVCPPLPALQSSKSSFATEVTGKNHGLHQENEGPLENEYAEIPELELTTPAAHGASTAVNETGRNEEDEDEGFGAEEEVLFRDATLLSKPTAIRLDVVEQLSDQRTSGAHTCSEMDFSSEEQLYANETMDVGIAKAAVASALSSPQACDAAVVPSAPYWYELASELDSQTHVYEMVPPPAAVPPATCNPLIQYAMVDNKRVSDSGFFSNRPADPADKGSEASTEPGSPHTNPDEENVYSTVENHDAVFTCSTTFQVPQNSRPVTLDCTYRFSFGSGTKSARARGSSEGTVKGNVSAFEREGIKDALISPSVTDTQNRSCKGELYRNSMCTDQGSFREDFSRNNSATGWGNPREQLSSFESEGECVVRGGVSDEESILQGESVYSSIGPPFYQGFLSLQESLAAAWKRRWCVLSEGTFTWFRTRREATLSGWLDKQGQGRPPLRLARRSWKRRWFVLQPSGLAYYDNDREERQRGTIDLASVREVFGDEHRENCFDVITEDRTYRLRAPSQEDASRWLGLLERVRGATEGQLQKMFQESSDPNSALGSLEAGMLDEAYADADDPDRPHTFALVSGSRTLFCNADTADDMQRWLMLLQRSKRDIPGDGGNILRGWLYKASDASSLVPTGRGLQGPLRVSCPRLRRRWFVLTAGALEYYRGSEANAPRAGCLVLTPMCSVSPLDGTQQGRTGNWSFTVYGRRDSYTLYSRQQGEATRWVHAIQRAIDSKGCADTPTSLLIQDIAESGDDPDLVDRTCTRNPILRYSPRALLSPLLPLPYGDNHSNPYGYSSLSEEAVRLSLCLLELEGVRDPTPMVQGILQTCWDLIPLRDELYCQLVKQTMTWEGVDGPTMGGWEGKGDGSLNLRVWHLLACTSCTFAPSHAVLRYLHLHLRRALERSRDQELCRYVAFTWTALQCKLCRQSVPSRDEIQALAEGREISTTIFCHGGGSCPISITSHVTAGEVVARLLRGLKMEGSCSKFALFECGPDGERAIEENALLVDSLARFERLAATREGVDKNQWKIFFKLYLVLDTVVAQEDSIEMAFMFEQAHDSMARGRFPVSGETLQWMAALRLQFVHGNCATVETEASSCVTNSPLEMHLEDFYPTGHSQMFLSSSISTLATSTGTPTTPASPVTPGSVSRPFTFSQDMVPTPPDSTAVRVVERSTRGEGLLRRSLREAAGSFLRLRRSRRDRQERADHDARGQLLTLRADILAKWRLLHDTDPEQAVAKYMQLVRQWSGYGATLFDVQCTDGQFPRELWLAVSLKSLSVYVRGQAEPIVSFPYERILSFGAAPPADDAHQSLISTPLLPTFQLIIDGQEIIFQTNEVAEISKLMEAYINVIMRKGESVHSKSQLCKS